MNSKNFGWAVKRVRSLSVAIVFSFLSAGFCGLIAPVPMAAAQSASVGGSGLPLPRFVSLKSKRVNMRVGPGREYQVVWLYLKAGLPMEIIQEYDNWRKVRDPEGNEGWILHSLLSGKRTAIIKPWENSQSGVRARLFSKSSESSGVTAEIEPGVVTEVSDCGKEWCQLEVADISGYIKKTELWGVYPDELIDN